MKITSVSLTFCITPLLILLCLITPVQATPLQISQHSTSQVTSQTITPQKKGISAYQKNLDRLRTSTTSLPHQPINLQPAGPNDSLQQPPLESSEKPLPKEEPLTQTTANQQQNQPQKKQLQEGKEEKEDKQQSGHNKFSRSTQPYAIIKAAQKPHLSQHSSPQISPPSLTNITQKATEQLSNQVTQLYTVVNQQPERLRNEVARPLQRKVIQLKKQIDKTSTDQNATDNRVSAASGSLIFIQQSIQATLSPIGERIQHIQTSLKTSLKSALIRLLEQVETKAHQITERLSES